MSLGNCKGLPSHARLGVGSTIGLTLLIFASPSETLSGLRCPWTVVRSSHGLTAVRLASRLSPDSSLGVVIDPPLHRLEHLMSTPCEFAAPKSCRPASSRGKSPADAESHSVRGCHLPNTFRPCRFARLRRFSPSGTVQVCCALLPIMGFAMFPIRRALVLHQPDPPTEVDCLGADLWLLSGRTPRGASVVLLSIDSVTRRRLA